MSASDWEQQPEFERGGEFSEATFLAILKEATATLDEEGLDYLLMGGIASATIGRPRWTHDIDIMVRPQDAKTALSALAARGFITQETYPDWLYKALRDGVLVDLIFKSSGDIYLDDEMLQRATERDFMGHPVRVIAPEDLLVIKAIVSDEHITRHWYDSLAIIASFDLDWEYLLKRARTGAKRVLSLLVFAQSNDLVVPNEVIRKLYEMNYS